MIIFIFIFIFFVPQAGIEPAHPKAYVPKTYVSTKFHHWGLLWIPKESNLNHLIFSQEH